MGRIGYAKAANGSQRVFGEMYTKIQKKLVDLSLNKARLRQMSLKLNSSLFPMHTK